MPRSAPPQPQYQQPPQPQYQPPPEPMLVDADFGVSSVPPLPEPEPKRRRPALLKWGLGALIVSLVAFGLWFALSHATGPAGLQLPGTGTLDPDDPRSRKADRLPSNF